MVPPLCLGTGFWSTHTGVPEALEVMDHALEVGLNFWDTADSYASGGSESVIGQGLKGRRQRVVLATKVHTRVAADPNKAGLSRTHIMRQVEASLGRLKTDYIDLYQMHRPDHQTPVEETLRAFDDLVSQGKVRYIGSSNFSGAQLVETEWKGEANGFVVPSTEQSPLSLIRRGVESGVLPWCRKYGLAFLAYSPLARGILAGKKYRPNQPVPKGSLVEEMGAHTEPWYPEALRVMERLESHSQAKECSLSQFSLAWVAAQESVIPIMGARTIEQIDDNLGALEVEITAEDLALVDELSPIGVLG